MFDNLSSRFEKVLQSISGKGRITDINISDTVKEIRKILLDADVNYEVVQSLIQEIQEQAMGEKVLQSIGPREQFIKIVHDRLKEIMGSVAKEINVKSTPSIILIAGLQGSGKTTFSAKLASFLKKQNKKILLVACDVYRPAAIEQLKMFGKQIEIDVFSDEKEKKPIKIIQKALENAKINHHQVVIIDTAGRTSVDEEMMKEITLLKKKTNPDETLFVVDSMMGQEAVNTAKIFHESIHFDGVVLTKMDGDARGGAAISINSVVKKPIKFISNGEKIDDLEIFHPDRMANRILGMGDVVTLVEKTQKAIDKKEAFNISQKIQSNRYNFNDFYKQIQQLKKMGDLKDVLSLIPGMGSKMRNEEINFDMIKPMESIILSMTPKERAMPQIINQKRKNRIANGSGTSIQEVNKSLKQLEQMKKMGRMVKKGNFMRNAKNLLKKK